MKRKNGFTLIELLVVIAIIALLMSILLPSLTRVRKNAKTTICIMNLKTWGLMIRMYADDNNGSTHGVHTQDTAWQTAYRSWYEDQPKIRCCPEATKPGTDKQGNPTNAKNPYSAWGIFPKINYYNFKEGDYGSYGENGWMQNGVQDNEYFGKGLYWKTPYAKGVSNVPAFVGCNWMHGVTTSKDTPPSTNGGTGNNGCMDRYCMDRHNGYVGSSFLDSSARKVGIKELWTLKWHRAYNIADIWTRAGKVEPEDWPDWMQNFKDY